MKKLLLFATISLLFFNSFGQNALTFTEVVKVDSLITKEDLFSRAEFWMANAYKNAQKVIQVRDKENGQIMGKAVIPYKSSVFTGSDLTNGVINYTITIYLKQGRYKYEITNFTHEPYKSDSKRQSMGLITTDEEYPGEGTAMFPKSWKTKVWKDIKEKINADMELLLADLNKGMAKKAEAKNDNW